MSKKSYMDNDNLLIEGFFDKLGKFLKAYTKIKNQKKLEKQISKNPAIKKQVKDINNKIDALNSKLNKQAKELGIKLPYSNL
tara:strand:- start:469 stop:714 length:246 start_codon:yes stop_codon:yes gene_type:complete